jgi:hypothetical protein
MATPLVSTRFKDVRVAGRNLATNLVNNVESMSVELSNSAVSAFKVTFADTHEFNVYRSTVVNPGQTLTYEGWTFEIGELETDSGKGGPSVSLTCLSKRVTALMKQTGEKNWGKAVDVSAWVTSVAKSAGFIPVVQPGLGKAEITRAKPDGGEAESTWDVLVKLRDEKGVWLFEYGNRLVFAKPTWWVKVNGITRWNYTWSTVAEHSPDLLATPKYTRSPSAERDQREKLTLTVTGDRVSAARPGDFVILNSRLPNVGFKGSWIIESVEVGSTVREPVVLSCLRIVDPVVRTPAAASLIIPNEMSNNPAGPVAGYNGQQLTNARRIVSAAMEMGIGIHGQRVGVMTAMGESSLINVNHGDAAGPDSRGLFQQRDNGAWGSLSDRLNPTIAATNFFKALLKVPNWSSLPPTLAAHYTQRNADPNHYTKYWSAAVQVVAAIHAANPNYKPGGASSGGAASSGGSSALWKKAQNWMNATNGKYIDFDGAYGAQCVDVFKFYNRDVVGGPPVLGNGNGYYWQDVLLGKYTRLGPGVTPQFGDVACWGSYYGGVYGHIALVVKDLGNGWMEVFSQNPSPAKYQNLSKQGLQGFLRPKGI